MRVPAVTRSRVALIIYLLVCSRSEAAPWYVDASAPPGGNGTSPANAFQTIQAAANVAGPGDTVMIKSGIYRETVTPRNSGNSSAPITYQPWGSSDVVTVSGADDITGDLIWAPTPGQNYYQTSFGPGTIPNSTTTYTTTNNQAEQLYVNGQAMVEARYPHLSYSGTAPITPLQQQLACALIWDNPGLLSNTNQTVVQATPGGYPQYAPLSAQIVYPGWKRLTDTCAGLSSITGNINGAIICVRPEEIPNLPSWGFSVTGYVNSHASGSNSIVFDLNDQGYPGLEANYPGTPFYLQSNPKVSSTLCLMGAPGEWYHDVTRNVIYLYDPKGGSPSDNADTIEIKRRDYAFDLDSKSYITIKNINVFAATITTDESAGEGGTASGPNNDTSSWTTIGRGDFTHGCPTVAAPSSHIILDGIKAKYINHFTDCMGFPGSQWTQNSGIVVSGTYQTIQNSVVDGADGNGILCLGQNNSVANNVVVDTNIMGTNAAAITGGNAELNQNFRITENTISSTGFDGIHVNHLYSTDSSNPAEVDHNRVSDFGVLCHDVGGIKIEPTSTESFNGTRWDHNRISDGDWLSNGIYWDTVNGTPDLIADHNITWNTDAGANINANQDCSLYNNTFLSYNVTLTANGTISGDQIVNNIFLVQPSLPFISASTNSNNIYGATGALFVDPNTGNVQLQSSASLAIGKGFNLGPPYTPDGGSNGLPWDIGAYQYPNTPWWNTGVGSTVSYLQPAPTNLTATIAGPNINLTWTNNAVSAANVYVERAVVTGNRHGFEVVAQLPATSTSWTDNGSYPANQGAGYLSLSLLYRVRTEKSMVSNTAIPISTPTPTSVPNPTPGPTSTPNPTPGPTSTPSPTPAPISTPSPTPAPISTPSPTPTPTSAPSPTPTPNPTRHRRLSRTRTPNPTPTSVQPTPTPGPRIFPTPPPQYDEEDEDNWWFGMARKPAASYLRNPITLVGQQLSVATLAFTDKTDTVDQSSATSIQIPFNNHELVAKMQTQITVTLDPIQIHPKPMIPYIPIPPSTPRRCPSCKQLKSLRSFSCRKDELRCRKCLYSTDDRQKLGAAKG